MTESPEVSRWEGLTPPYRTIVADPPWDVLGAIRHGGRRARTTPKPYSTMTAAEIMELPVGELAADVSSLWLWITPPLNRSGVGDVIATAWGFLTRSEIVWSKPNLGMGSFPRTSHEILLVCSRGVGALEDAPRDVHSVQGWAQVYGNNGGKSHSAKPAASFDLIERSSPGPYVELFARQPRLGWDHWGYGVEAVNA